MDLKKIKHIHFSGIKGVGMTALALYAQDMGKTITGSDVQEEFVTQEVLESRAIPITFGFKAENLPGQTDLVVFSAAHPNNEQVKLAVNKKIPALSYAQALAQITRQKQTIAVCGVGGKSTTAAMIAQVLEEARLNPSFIIGAGNVTNFNVPGRFVDGKYAVLEADDYAAVPKIDNTPKFLFLRPQIIVATNIEFDHPDIYNNLEESKEVFLSFFKLLPDDGLLVANSDNQNLKTVVSKIKELRPKLNILTYGYSPQADCRISAIAIEDQKTDFSISHKVISIDYSLSVPGRFNAANATAALLVATHLGADLRKISQALKNFKGLKRRFEKVGSFKQVEVWDDYAHHPSEIKATLRAAKSWFKGRKIIAVFQPHTYSRTKALLAEFAKSLSLADEVIITEIFASAREEKDPTISGKDLARKAQEHNKNTSFINFAALLEYLVQTEDNTIILTLGAGDIYKVARKLVSK